MNRNLAKMNQRRDLFDPFGNFFDFENFLPAWPGKNGSSIPAVNVSEDNKAYHVEVIAPGFKKEDFKINVEDDMLTISAETKHETTEGGGDNKQYTRREYSYNSFTRSFRLPDNAKDDNITAGYENGILNLGIPKSEQQVKATKEIIVK